MRVNLVFVPPGGGEADYSLDFELPSVPQPGDYITISRPDQDGTEDFIVRRTWWYLEYPGTELYRTERSTVHGKVQSLTVECEFARGFLSSEAHKRGAGPDAKTFEASTY